MAKMCSCPRQFIRQRVVLLNFVLFLVVCCVIYNSPPSCPQSPSLQQCRAACNSNSITRLQLQKKVEVQSVEVQVSSPSVNDSQRAKAIVFKFDVITSDPYLADNASFFVPRTSVVNSFVPDWLLQPSPCPAHGPWLLVVIPTLDAHSGRRTAIRHTWASPAHGAPWPARPALANNTVKVVFFLGVSGAAADHNLELEAQTFGDIVRANFSDTYHNLSLKMAAVLHWSATYCRGARHVMKVDEDTFVHLPVLLRVLEILGEKGYSKFVLGRKHSFPKPRVLRQGRWGVSKDLYPLSFYPKYSYGPSYVISGDAIAALHYASRHMPVIPNEDAYVTGILAKTANVTRIQGRHFAMEVRPPSCPLAQGKVISQTLKGNSSQFYRMWDLLKSDNCSRSNSGL